MGTFLLWATWAHEYMALKKCCQRINEMMAVAVINFLNF